MGLHLPSWLNTLREEYYDHSKVVSAIILGLQMYIHVTYKYISMIIRHTKLTEQKFI